MQAQALQRHRACSWQRLKGGLVPRRRPALPARQSVITAAASSAATWAAPPTTQAPYKVPPFPAVPPLPPPPDSAKMASVLNYLAKLALSERQLAWRLGVAFLCMVLSKGAGARVRVRVCVWWTLPP
jgi:hypothetical protein